MNILFFSRSFYPNIGGVEKHVYEISIRLIKKGHKVTVITESGNNAEIRGYQSEALNAKLTDEVSGIKIIRINTGPEEKLKKFRIWLSLIKYSKLIKKADIVHCHDIFFWYLPFRFIFLNKPVFTTFHGYEGNNVPGKKAILMHKIAEKLSKGNICVGDFLEKWYGTKATIVTYGAVKLPAKQNRLETTYIKKILYIGRLEKEAGIMTYLKALNVLKSKKINFELTVLGDGAQGKEAREYCKENKLKVEFKGFVKDVNEYLPNVDMVFSGRYLGVMEAFSYRKFVAVEYNNLIKKDVFGFAPYRDYIILEKDYKKLANEIEFYTKNTKLMNEKISKAYEWVKTQTWEKMVKDYLALWKISN